LIEPKSKLTLISPTKIIDLSINMFYLTRGVPLGYFLALPSFEKIDLSSRKFLDLS
jgi:hypothetical protein